MRRTRISSHGRRSKSRPANTLSWGATYCSVVDVLNSARSTNDLLVPQSRTSNLATRSTTGHYILHSLPRPSLKPNFDMQLQLLSTLVLLAFTIQTLAVPSAADLEVRVSCRRDDEIEARGCSVQASCADGYITGYGNAACKCGLVGPCDTWSCPPSRCGNGGTKASPSPALRGVMLLLMRPSRQQSPLSLTQKSR